MTKVHGKRYAYRFDFNGISHACRNHNPSSTASTRPSDGHLNRDLSIVKKEISSDSNFLNCAPPPANLLHHLHSQTQPSARPNFCPSNNLSTPWPALSAAPFSQYPPISTYPYSIQITHNQYYHSMPGNKQELAGPMELSGLRQMPHN